MKFWRRWTEREASLLILPDGGVEIISQCRKKDVLARDVLLQYPNHALACIAPQGGKTLLSPSDVLQPGSTYYLLLPSLALAARLPITLLRTSSAGTHSLSSLSASASLSGGQRRSLDDMKSVLQPPAMSPSPHLSPASSEHQQSPGTVTVHQAQLQARLPSSSSDGNMQHSMRRNLSSPSAANNNTHQTPATSQQQYHPRPSQQWQQLHAAQRSSSFHRPVSPYICSYDGMEMGSSGRNAHIPHRAGGSASGNASGTAAMPRRCSSAGRSENAFSSISEVGDVALPDGSGREESQHVSMGLVWRGQATPSDAGIGYHNGTAEDHHDGAFGLTGNDWNNAAFRSISFNQEVYMSKQQHHKGVWQRASHIPYDPLIPCLAVPESNAVQYSGRGTVSPGSQGLHAHSNSWAEAPDASPRAVDSFAVSPRPSQSKVHPSQVMMRSRSMIPPVPLPRSNPRVPSWSARNKADTTLGLAAVHMETANVA